MLRFVNTYIFFPDVRERVRLFLSVAMHTQHSYSVRLSPCPEYSKILKDSSINYSYVEYDTYNPISSLYIVSYIMYYYIFIDILPSIMLMNKMLQIYYCNCYRQVRCFLLHWIKLSLAKIYLGILPLQQYNSKLKQ